MSTFLRAARTVALILALPFSARAMQQPSAPATLAPAPAPFGELAIVNARLWTCDRRRPWADAVLVHGDRIEAVGASAAIRKRVTPATHVVDAHGMMVTPGFIDSHVHFFEGGFALSSVKLRDAKTKAEFIERIGDYAATLPAGAWILNGDWDHTSWGGDLPERSWIDSVTPNNPVWINRLDGHMSLANSAALRAAGVTAATADVEGGEIVRGPGREPTRSPFAPRTSRATRRTSRVAPSSATRAANRRAC